MFNSKIVADASMLSIISDWIISYFFQLFSLMKKYILVVSPYSFC